MLQHEWVDIPLGVQRLHTWIEYPAGTAQAPVVIVMSHEAGLDDWMRAVADQLAASLGDRTAGYDELIGDHLARAAGYRAELGPIDDDLRVDQMMRAAWMASTTIVSSAALVGV